MLNNTTKNVLLLENQTTGKVEYGTGFLVHEIDNIPLNYDYILTVAHFTDKNNAQLSVVAIYKNDSVFVAKNNLIIAVSLEKYNEEISIIKIEKNSLGSIHERKNIPTYGDEGKWMFTDSYFRQGSPVFYYGYPYFTKMSHGAITYHSKTKDFAVYYYPMIKKGFIMNEIDIFTNKIYVDTYNNPGFSGGPLFVKKDGINKLIGFIDAKHTSKTVGIDSMVTHDVGIGIAYSSKGIEHKILEMEEE